MLVIILFLIIGVSLGLSASRISILLKMNERMLTLSVYLLLFILAISIGADDLIVRNLDRIGWTSFIVIVGVIAVSTIVCLHLYKILFRKYKSKVYNHGDTKNTEFHGNYQLFDHL